MSFAASSHSVLSIMLKMCTVTVFLLGRVILNSFGTLGSKKALAFRDPLLPFAKRNKFICCWSPPLLDVAMTSEISGGWVSFLTCFFLQVRMTDIFFDHCLVRIAYHYLVEIFFLSASINRSLSMRVLNLNINNQIRTTATNLWGFLVEVTIVILLMMITLILLLLFYIVWQWTWYRSPTINDSLLFLVNGLSVLLLRFHFPSYCVISES